MAYFKLNYSVKYPDVFKKIIEDKCSMDREKLYEDLLNLTVENVVKIAESIRVDLIKLFPDLSYKLNHFPYKGAMDELIKNIFDSVNLKKLKYAEIASIDITVVVKNDVDKLTMKIKDNGLGFDHMKKSNLIDLSSYLTPAHPTIFKKMFVKDSSEKKTSKQYEKSLGKRFLLGGFSIGLKKLEKSVKKDGGSILIKNRKLSGASVEITIPYFNKLKKQAQELPACCPECKHKFKEKDFFWNKKNHEAEAVHCNQCNEFSFINPFKKI